MQPNSGAAPSVSPKGKAYPPPLVDLQNGLTAPAGLPPLAMTLSNGNGSATPKVQKYLPDAETGDEKDGFGEVAGEGGEGERDTFAQIYNEYAKDGIITGDDLCDILREVGVTAERTAVERLIAGSWTEIDFDTACDVLGALKGNESDTLNHVVEVTKTVVNISPWSYLWKVLTCSRDQSVVYKVDEISCSVSPRQVLISSTGLIMLFTCSLIIMLIALLWLQRGQSRESDLMHTFGIAFSGFVDSFEVQMLAANGRELGDSALMVSDFVGARARWQLNDTIKNALTKAHVASNIIDMSGNFNLGSSLAVAQRQLQMVQTVLQLVGTDATSAAITAQRFSALLARTASTLGASWALVALNRSTGSILFDGSSLCTVPTSCELTIDCFQMPVQGLAPGTAFNASENRFWSSTRSVGIKGAGAAAVGVHLSSPNGAVDAVACALQTQAAVEATTRNQVATFSVFAAATDLDYLSVNSNPEASKVQLEKALAARSSTGAGVQWLTAPPKPQFTAFCNSNDSASGTCDEMSTLVASALRDRRDAWAPSLLGPRGTPVAVAVAPSIVAAAAVVFFFEHSDFYPGQINELVQAFQYLNYVRIVLLGATVESTIISYNITTSAYAQITQVAFPNDCFDKCGRTQQAFANSITAFTYQSTGYGITPDYRPQPVVGGYCYQPEMGVSLVIERDVVEIRSIALRSLVDMVSGNNKNFQGSFELNLVHQLGCPPTDVYNPYQQCPSRTLCFSVGTKGVVYRSDCVDCMRFASSDHHLEFLTHPRKCPPGNISSCLKAGDIARWSVFGTDGQSPTGVAVAVGIDYTSTQVLGSYGFARNFSMGFFVKQDYAEIFNPITNQIIISFSSSIGMVVVALISLMTLSQKLVSKIEKEWMHFKEQIVLERRRFADGVKDLVPPQIAASLMAGKLLHVDTQPVALALMEISGMKGREEDWPPSALCCFVTYVFEVFQDFAAFYGVHRIRSIGDNCLYVSGLPEVLCDDTVVHLPHYVRIIHMFSAAYAVSTSRYAHFPHRTDLVEKAFGGDAVAFPDQTGVPEHVGSIKMPEFRVGIHYGGCTLCVINTHEIYTPHYDAYGHAVGLAVRMAHTCRNSCIHVTEALKEQVATVKDTGLRFGQPHTTLVRGRGYVRAYHVTDADVPIPPSLLQQLCIRYSKGRHVFNKDEVQIKDAGSIYSRSTDSSIRSKDTPSSLSS